ncbi:MAG: HNH endonuclease, partial [Methylosarcina sp.]
QGEVRRLFDYDSVTGDLIWKVCAPTSPKKPGDVAGCINGQGYRHVRIAGVKYKSSRLVWIWHHGEIPDGVEIDHEDRDRANDRIENLRQATSGQNSANTKRKKNQSGLRGVYKNGNKFQAKIRVDGNQTYLGSFDTPEAAHAVYLEAAKKAFGEFASAA